MAGQIDRLEGRPQEEQGEPTGDEPSEEEARALRKWRRWLMRRDLTESAEQEVRERT